MQRKTIWLGLLLLSLGLGGVVWATTYNTVNVLNPAGPLSDFKADEKVPSDPTGDSLYGPNNDLKDLWATWDANNFYLGFDYAAWGTAVMVLIDTGVSGGVSTFCRSAGYKVTGAYPANIQGPAWDNLVAVWVEDDALTSPVVSVHSLDKQDSTDITLAAGVTIGQKDSADAKVPVWNGQVAVALQWDRLYKLGAGKVPKGATIKVVAVIRGGKDDDGLGDANPDPSQAISKNNCASGTKNTLDKFHVFTIDNNQDGKPDANWKPGTNKPGGTTKPDAGIPDQKVAQPDQKVAKPDQKVAQVDQKVGVPDQKVAKPDQKVVQPDQKVAQADQKVVMDSATAQKDGPVQADKGGQANKDLGWADSAVSAKDASGGEKPSVQSEEGCACSASSEPPMSMGVLLLGLLTLARVDRRRRS